VVGDLEPETGDDGGFLVVADHDETEVGPEEDDASGLTVGAGDPSFQQLPGDHHGKVVPEVNKPLADAIDVPIEGVDDVFDALRFGDEGGRSVGHQFLVVPPVDGALCDEP